MITELLTVLPGDKAAQADTDHIAQACYMMYRAAGLADSTSASAFRTAAVEPPGSSSESGGTLGAGEEGVVGWESNSSSLFITTLQKVGLLRGALSQKEHLEKTILTYLGVFIIFKKFSLKPSEILSGY